MLFINTSVACTGSVPTKVNCTHYWKIAPSNGPTSVGICDFCGAKRDFENSLSRDTQQIIIQRNE